VSADDRVTYWTEWFYDGENNRLLEDRICLSNEQKFVYVINYLLINNKVYFR
jgi:hypothetical protein